MRSVHVFYTSTYVFPEEPGFFFFSGALVAPLKTLRVLWCVQRQVRRYEIGFSSLFFVFIITPPSIPHPSRRSSSLFIFHRHRGSESVSEGFSFFPLLFSTERQETWGARSGVTSVYFARGGPRLRARQRRLALAGPVLTPWLDNLLFWGRAVVGGAVHLVGRRSCETASARRVLVCLPLPEDLKWQHLKQAQIREPAPVTLTDGAVMGPYPTSSDWSVWEKQDPRQSFFFQFTGGGTMNYVWMWWLNNRHPTPIMPLSCFFGLRCCFTAKSLTFPPITDVFFSVTLAKIDSFVWLGMFRSDWLEEII